MSFLSYYMLKSILQQYRDLHTMKKNYTFAFVMSHHSECL